MMSGTFQFSYTNNSGHSYSVYMSTNLKSWSNLGVAVETAPGVYQFTDYPTDTSPRFYQLRSP